MTRILVAALCSLAFATPAAAQGATYYDNGLQGPPASYPERMWTDPRTGCSYIRAQAPGYAPTWHLVINGAKVGLTNGRPDCPGFLNSRR